MGTHSNRWHTCTRHTFPWLFTC